MLADSRSFTNHYPHDPVPGFVSNPPQLLPSRQSKISAVSMWYSYISIDIDQYFTKYLDIDTPAIVARQNGAKIQCSIYQYRYLQ